MLASIRDAVKDDEAVYLFMDRAGYHRSPEVKAEMKELNIEPIYNVAYRFQYNPMERLWRQWKQNYRAVLLDKMLKGPGTKDTPLKDALHETFVMTDVSESIPRYIKKALGMLRRDANEIRSQNDVKELDDIK
jgi:hypothetical protein